MRPLPSLTALQAFEATARRLSVRHAAEELHVTPGAVSRQIKLLEQSFGMALVRRAGRGIALTDRGKVYYEAISGPFAGLREASSVLTRDAARTVITLRSHTTFATYWLLPRLAPFQLANPDIEVRLSMASEWSDLGGLDAVVRLGSGSWPGLKAMPLIGNVLTPVCAPAVAARLGKDPRRLLGQDLLATPHRPDDWNIWLSAAGLGGAGDFRFVSFESSALTYRAAAASRGVALAQLALVEEDLTLGHLARPFDLTVDRGTHTYYLLWEAESLKTESIQRLGTWLTA